MLKILYRAKLIVAVCEVNAIFTLWGFYYVQKSRYETE